MAFIPHIEDKLGYNKVPSKAIVQEAGKCLGLFIEVVQRFLLSNYILLCQIFMQEHFG